MASATTSRDTIVDVSAPERAAASMTPDRGAATRPDAGDEALELPSDGGLGLSPQLLDEGEIARGGMGAVHKVFDRVIRRHAAMKVLDLEVAKQPAAISRFVEEAQITGQLDHPNIVPVYALELTDSGIPRYFTMKLVAGETLTGRIRPELVARRTDRGLYDLLQIFLKVCDAVSFAHSRGVTHCDLKPDNIMVGTHGQVYVMDWGLARVGGRPLHRGEAGVSIDRAESKAAAGPIMGTPQYMAPEQAWGRPDELDARTDVFALGAVLYHVLTGFAPHHGSASEAWKLARAGIVRPPSEVVPGVALPPALCDIAMRALAASPAERWASVEALKHEVERFVRGGWWLASKSFKAGTVVVLEGAEADAAYIITQGRCEAYKVIDGKRVVLRQMGPGEIFGETAILTSHPRTASIAALDDITVLVVTRESLARELGGDSWLGTLVRALAERFRELDARVSASGAAQG